MKGIPKAMLPKKIVFIFFVSAVVVLIVCFKGYIFHSQNKDENSFIEAHTVQQPLLLLNRQIVTGEEFRDAIRAVAQKDPYGEYSVFPIQIIKVENPFTIDMGDVSKRDLILPFLSSKDSNSYLAASDRYEIKISHKEDATICVLIACQLSEISSSDDIIGHAFEEEPH